MLNRGTAALVVGFALFGVARFAAAGCVGTQAVSSCGTTCTANCYLNNDLNCGAGATPAVTLTNSANLDMCGHSIHCTASPSCAGGAVLMNTSSSQVYNTQSNATVSITGLFYTGVTCGGNTSTKVIGVHFSGIENYGVYSCSRVTQNVFFNPGSTAAVVSFGIANTDEIDNNYIEGPTYAVQLNSLTHKVTVDHNLINIGSNTGIVVTSPAHLFTVNDNVFQGSGTPVSDSSVDGTYTENYCDSSSANCATCISNNQCDTPEAPFSMP